MGPWLTPRNKFPHRCHHVKLGSSASKGARINTKEPPKTGELWATPPWSGGVADPLEIRRFITCYPAEFGSSSSNGTSVIKDPPENMTLTSCLSGSLKVMGTDTDRSDTYEFLLTFHTNHGPISYRFRDKRQFQSKITNFSNPVYWVPT